MPSAGMNNIKQNDGEMALKMFITRRPLASFLLLAFALALIPLAILHMLAPQLALPGTILIGLAPMSAALIVTAVIAGRAGVRRLLGGFLRWRFGAQFYFIALMLPCLVLLGAWLGLTLFGVEADFFVPALPGLALIVFLELLRGPLGEETGFRGFALPLLMRRYSLTSASFIAGGLSAIWRLPLLMMAGVSLFPGESARLGLFLAATSLATIALAIPLGWIFVKTESLIAPVLMRLGVALVFVFLVAPEDMKVLNFAASTALIALLWVGLMRLPRPESVVARPQLPASPFVSFQITAFISLLPWLFFYAVFNINNPIAERDVSIIVYFLFGTLWQVPLFLCFVSVGMWGAFVLRFRRAAYTAGLVLLLPLAAFALILLMQYIEYQNIANR